MMRMGLNAIAVSGRSQIAWKRVTSPYGTRCSQIPNATVRNSRFCVISILSSSVFHLRSSTIPSPHSFISRPESRILGPNSFVHRLRGEIPNPSHNLHSVMPNLESTVPHSPIAQPWIPNPPSVTQSRIYLTMVRYIAWLLLFWSKTWTMLPLWFFIVLGKNMGRTINHVY